MNLKVLEAVWLGAAVKAYETYHSKTKPTENDMYFRQVDIQKKAQKFTESAVQHARVNQWANGDHTGSQANYLREGKDKTRRLTFNGEFQGIKERPQLNETDRIDTTVGIVTVGDIYRFVENEYTALFTIDFFAILDYLEQYASLPYKNPNTASGEEKEQLELMRELGGVAVTELNKVALLCGKKYGLRNKIKSKWLTGGNDRIRRYFWEQLKLEQFMDLPTSLSLFVEAAKDNDHKVRIRLAVELDEKVATEEDYERHHQFLNETTISPELSYYVKESSTKHNYHVFTEEPSIIKAKLENNTYKKVQLTYVLSYEEINEKQMTNEQILQKVFEGVEKLLPYYRLAINEATERENDPDILKSGEDEYKVDYSKNMILYGPPGTGKTYNTVNYAVAIIENRSIESICEEDYETVLERYNNYRKSGQINFTTFHQSYGYEEFIEGIKPTLEEDQDEHLQYKIESGIFKVFCENAQQLKVTNNNEALEIDSRVWKVSLGGSGMNEVKDDCFRNNRIRIGWDEFGENLTEGEESPSSTVKDIMYSFYDDMSIGDIVFSLGDEKHIDAIGIITGEPEWLSDKDRYKRSRQVKWIAKNINEYVYELNGKKKLTQRTVYELKRMSNASVNEIILKYAQHDQITVEENHKNFVFIIDEINRGNISKILGELITLIEPTKRIGAPEQIKVRLPYSKIEFGVPQNVYILGTMNTADRSIAMMDTALRRRFRFIEMMPDADLLQGINVDNIDIKHMVQTINKRIEVLYDREHTIGHAYFMGLRNEPTIENLESIFKNAIIPLLQEYFFEDYSKIQLILGDNAKADEFKFILDTHVYANTVFKLNPDIDIPEKKYSIQLAAFKKPASYIEIYE